MKKVKSIIVGLFVFLAFVIAGCGGGGGGQASNSSSTTKVSSSTNSGISTNKPVSSSEPAEHVHKYVVVEEIIENCEGNKIVIYECDCGDKYSKEEPSNRDHNYSDWKVVKEPTEKEKGLERRICGVCHFEEEREIDVLEHKHDYHPGKVHSPSCESEGYTEYECACGDKYYDNYTPALNHNYGEWKVEIEPSLTSAGFATRTCLNDENHKEELTLPAFNETDYAYDVYNDPTCEEEGYATYTYVHPDKLFVFEIILEKKEHKYGNWEVVKAPTFEEKGLVERVCELNEEAKESYELPELNLNGFGYDLEIIKEANCEEEGLVKFIYSLKGEEIIIEAATPAKRHSFGGEIGYIPAGCETPSYYTYTCLQCGEVVLKEAEEAPHGHSYTNNWEIIELPGSIKEGKAVNYCDYDNSHFVEYILPLTTEDVYQKEVIQERSCAQEGITRYTYYVLGTNDSKISFEIVVEPYSHNYSQTIIQPSCDKEGYTEYLCDECGDYYTDNHVRPYGHDLTYHLYQPSTCEQDGIMEHYYCINCNRYFLDAYGSEEVSEESIIIKASGHKFSPWQVVTVPTLSSTGKIERTCFYDNYVEEVIIDRLNKDTYEYVLVRESNCLDYGIEKYIWVEDGQEIVFEITTPAHDHEYLPWEVVEAPTLTSEGSIISICKYDKEHYLEATLPILSEEEYEYTVLTAPTCEDSGLANYYYFHINTEFNFEAEIAPLNHAYGEWIIDVAPTKEEKGSLIRRCGNNEEHFETHELPVLNEEDYEYVLINDSTCLEEGLEQYIIMVGEQNIIIESSIPTKNHEPSATNLYDENNHWDQCDCGTAYNIEEHDFVDGYCSVCGVHESIKLLTIKIVNNAYYQVYDCNEEAIHIEIPETYKGLPVDYVANGAFINCDKLESVVIPKTLSFRYSHDYFKHCPNLTNVYFKGDVVDWCNMNLQGIQFVSEDLHLFFYEDGEYVEVIDLVIPEGVTSINEKQFAYFNNIKTVVIPSTVETIGNYAFYKNNKLTSVEINEGASLIGRYAFSECSSLERVNIPSTVKEISEYAFNECVSLRELEFEKGLEIIGNYAFYNNDGLTTLSLPTSLIRINYSAFKDCDGLVDIVIPESVTHLGSSAFEKCDNIETVDVLNKDCYIDYNVFLEDYKITEMRLPVSSVGTFSNVVSKDIQTLKKVVITGGTALRNEYFRYFGSIETVVLPSGILEIGDYAFEKMTSLISVNIPSGVTSIGYSAFEYCSSLPTIILPDTLTTLGYSAFAECSNLQTVVLSERLQEIQSYTFEYCVKLSSITIPDSVESIGLSAFYGCRKLETASISSTSKISNIDRFAFSNCTLLKEIYLPSALEVLGDDAFNDCNSLETIIFGPNCKIKTIENYTFYNCYSISSINLEECTSLEIIPDRAFYYSKSIKEVNIPANVTTIGASAFYYFNGKLSFASESKLETINYSAFNSLKQKTLSLPDSLLTIKGNAFASVELNELIIPDEVKTIEANAFGYAKKVILPASVEVLNSGAFNALEDNAVCDVYYQGTLEQLLDIQYAASDISAVIFTKYTTVYVNNKKISGDVVIENATVIPGYLFANSDVETITINSQITTIEEGAFYNCRKLKSINLENQENLLEIYGEAFYNCYSLESIYIPNTVTSIASYTFVNCLSLSSVVFEENTSLRELYYSTFDNLPLLYSIEFPEGMETVSVDFEKCYNLMSVKVPSTATGVISVSSTSGVVEIINKSSAEYSKSSDMFVKIINEDQDSSLEITEDGFVFTQDEEGEYVLVRYLGKEPILTLPESHKGNPYTVDKRMLLNNEYVNVLVAPSDLGFSIYDFTMANALKQIITSEGTSKIEVENGYVMEIGISYNYLIKYLGEEENVVLPETILGRTYTIEEDAFVGNKTMKSISIPASIASVKYVNFNDCENLVSVTLEEGSKVYLGTFTNCYSLTTLPQTNYQGTYSFNDSYRFKNCYSLTSLTIKDSITKIGLNDFENCYNLRTISLPDTVKSIGREAFMGCTSLTSIIIPSSVTSIGSNAFYNCINLESAILNEGLTFIGNYAFAHCTSLESIIIPSTVESIGYYAFSKTGVKNVTFVEGSRLTILEQNTFAECLSLETVSLAEGLETIGYGVFKQCVSLKSIIIPSTVLAIESGAFTDCVSLTSVKILGNVTSIAASTFENCYQLRSVTLPDTITSIGGDAFANNFKLSEINMPKELVSIGGDAFKNCYLLGNVEFPDKLTSIGGFAFCGCKEITEIIIPDSVTTLGTGSFQHANVTKVVFGKDSSMTTLNNQAIDAYLDVLVLPTSITSVASNAFTMRDNSKIFYYGTSEEWNQITFKSANTTAKATVYYYSEEAPTEEGNFWHFADDGETIAIW